MAKKALRFSLRAFSAFLWLLFNAFRGALVFVDRLRLRQQRIAKRTEHLEQQIEFLQTLSPRPHRAEKKFQLNTSTTVSNRQHIVAPFIFAAATRFDFRQNVRSRTTR